jgi:hypothetical protein
MTPARTEEVTVLRRHAEKLRQIACEIDDVDRARTVNCIADGCEREALSLRAGEGAVLAVLRGLPALRGY